MLVLGERVGVGPDAAILAGLRRAPDRAARRGGWPGLDLRAGLGRFCVTVRDLVSRMMSRGVPSLLVAAMAAGGVMGFGAVGAAFVDWAAGRRWGRRSSSGGRSSFLLVGYLAMVGAMRVGEVAFVTPFRYTSLLVAVVLGVALCGTVPDARRSRALRGGGGGHRDPPGASVSGATRVWRGRPADSPIAPSRRGRSVDTPVRPCLYRVHSASGLLRSRNSGQPRTWIRGSRSGRATPRSSEAQPHRSAGGGSDAGFCASRASRTPVGRGWPVNAPPRTKRQGKPQCQRSSS